MHIKDKSSRIGLMVDGMLGYGRLQFSDKVHHNKEGRGGGQDCRVTVIMAEYAE